MTILPPKSPENVHLKENQLFFTAPLSLSGGRLQGYEVLLFLVITSASLHIYGVIGLIIILYYIIGLELVNIWLFQENS